MKRILHTSLRNLLAGILVSFTLLVIVLSSLFYLNERKHIEEETYDYLSNITKGTLTHLDQWRLERLSEAKFFSSVVPFGETAGGIINGDSDAAISFRRMLSHIMTNERYENIFLILPDGKLLFSYKEGYENPEEATLHFSREVLDKEEILFNDFFPDKATHQKVFLEMAAPVYNESNKAVAVLVFRINPAASLIPSLREWSPEGKPDLLHIVRQEGDTVWYLNKMTDSGQLPRSYGVPSTDLKRSAAFALTGKEGPFRGLNYAGEEVIADIRKVPGTAWFLISETGVRDVFENTGKIFVKTVLFAVFIILLVASLISLLYKHRQMKIFRELYEKSEQYDNISEELKATLYSIGDGVITANSCGIIERINIVAEGMTGWKESEAKGRRLDEVYRLLNEESDREEESLVEILRREEKLLGVSAQSILVSKKGKKIPIANSAALIKNRNGETLGIIVVFSDQTQQRAKQARLRESEERFARLFQDAPLAYQSLDRKGCIVDINRAWTDTFGFSPEEVSGKWIGEIIIPEDRDPYRMAFLKVLREGVMHTELRMNDRNGKISLISVDGQLSLKMDGSFDKIHCILQDITERRKMEERLRESEEKYRRIAENMSDVIWTIDTDLNTTYVSPSVERLIGEPAEVHKQKSLGERLPPHSLIKLKTILAEEMEKEKDPLVDKSRSRLFEIEHYKADGGIIWLGMNVSIIRDSKGNVTGYQGTTRDISELKKNEMELRDREERHRLIMDNSMDAILLTKPDGSILSANRSACEMFQMTEEEICAVGRDGIVDTGDTRLEKLIETRNRLGRVKGELTFIRKDGTRFPSEITSSIFRDSKGELRSSMIIRDVTERKSAEKKLRENEEKYRELSHHLIKVREDERLQIARELHDDLGQKLTVLSLSFSRIKSKIIPQFPELEKPLEDLSGLHVMTVESLNRISSGLRPSVLDDLGICAAVKWLVREFSKSSGIGCSLICNPETLILNDKLTLAVFRIIQESLTNVARHSDATKASVLIKADSEHIILRIKDNGKGIDNSGLSDRMSFGLIGMRERTEVFGGTFRIGNRPGKGTRITAIIPLNGNGRDHVSDTQAVHVDSEINE